MNVQTPEREIAVRAPEDATLRGVCDLRELRIRSGRVTNLVIVGHVPVPLTAITDVTLHHEVGPLYPYPHANRESSRSLRLNDAQRQSQS